MKTIALVALAGVPLGGVVAYVIPATGQAEEAAPIFVKSVPRGYRDW